MKENHRLTNNNLKEIISSQLEQKYVIGKIKADAGEENNAHISIQMEPAKPSVIVDIVMTRAADLDILKEDASNGMQQANASTMKTAVSDMSPRVLHPIFF